MITDNSCYNYLKSTRDLQSQSLNKVDDPSLHSHLYIPRQFIGPPLLKPSPQPILLLSQHPSYTLDDPEWAVESRSISDHPYYKMSRHSSSTLLGTAGPITLTSASGPPLTESCMGNKRSSDHQRAQSLLPLYAMPPRSDPRLMGYLCSLVTTTTIHSAHYPNPEDGWIHT